MKSLYLLFSLSFILVFTEGFSQGLAPSTVRQVFALDKGDSLEYHIWTMAQICGTVCDVYKWKVVDTTYYSNMGDTLFIKFTDQIIHVDSVLIDSIYCQPACYDYVDGLVTDPRHTTDDHLWAVGLLDSSIIGVDTTLNYWSSLRDSIASDSLKYNGAKQSSTLWSANIIGYGRDVFADSLGAVYHTWLGYEAPDAQNQELIYYHKTNGKMWGDRKISTAVNEVQEKNNIVIYPNPTDSRFMIKLDHYQDANFILYDILGKSIINMSILSNETEVNKSNIPVGIYHWQITQADHIIKTGKLIIE